MAGTQLLRLLVNERLAAAAEEIFGLVEKTIAEYQDEVVRSRTEIIQLRKQLEQLTVLKPKVMLFRADIQSVSEKILHSQQTDQLPTVEKNKSLDSEQVKEEQVDLCITPHLEEDSSEDVKVRLTETTQTDYQLLPTFSTITVTLNEDDVWNNFDDSSSCGPSHSDAAFTQQEQAQKVQVDTFPPLCPSDTKPVSEELLLSLQQCDIKVEQIEEYPQVKEEQVDQCLSPDMEADTSNNDEVRLPKSDPTTDCELVPSSAAETVSANESIEDKQDESDSSSMPHQSHSVEVFVELEQPPKNEKFCRFCGKRFTKDSCLIRHVKRSHKGQKAFKCLECNEAFEQRYHLVVHVRTHTGEKPFSCDICGRKFTQNSSRIVHMRVHTGEKPYYCAKCGKSFSTKWHSKFCGVPKECTVTKKTLKCSECKKKFHLKHHLVMHSRVHTGEKPFSCDFCDQTFTQYSNRIVHMRKHTGEKPYFCKKCGKRFASSHHLKLCTGTQDQSTNRSASTKRRCMVCSRIFHSDLDMKVHMEVHESWKQHVDRKPQKKRH